ncbi:hypothetical protein CEXT_589821 [Caerostris extrusa]|uniref:Uncharacterized protein n=1 Tax=Caerostris extrusa TaxID=172846 RepID=A0AAV4NY56_CAEEX|nr:hypothetical protein CEXT_589821 [Caerostris extrusa]
MRRCSFNETDNPSETIINANDSQRTPGVIASHLTMTSVYHSVRGRPLKVQKLFRRNKILSRPTKQFPSLWTLY